MCNSCGCNPCNSIFGLDTQTIILILLLWLLFCNGGYQTLNNGCGCGCSSNNGCGCNG